MAFPPKKGGDSKLAVKKTPKCPPGKPYGVCKGDEVVSCHVDAKAAGKALFSARFKSVYDGDADVDLGVDLTGFNLADAYARGAELRAD